MRIVIFGLTISSSWGNGHAVLWRGLCHALICAGHRVVFYERDVPWYAAKRECPDLPGGELRLYGGWSGAMLSAQGELADADAAIVTPCCPDALPARAAILDAGRPLAVFYDLDAPVTLDALAHGERVAWIDGKRLRDYDLVLSCTGGPALQQLSAALGARRVRALDQQTSAQRAQQLIAFLEQARAPGVERASTSLAAASICGFDPCRA